MQTISFFPLFLFSFGSKTYRLEKHAGCLCSDECGVDCFIPGAHDRDSLEKETAARNNKHGPKVCISKYRAYSISQ